MKTIRQIIQEAQKQGFKIRAYERKGGGLRITNINGVYFKGSAGNTYLRNVMGEPLSEAKRSHLKDITENVSVIKINRLTGDMKIVKKGTFGNAKKDPISKEVRNQITRLQKQFKKNENRKSLKGNISLSNYRYNLETYGEKEARRKLEEAELYAKGYAYTGNVKALRTRILEWSRKYPEFRKVYDLLNTILKNKKHLTEKSLMDIREELYNIGELVDIGLDDDEINNFYAQKVYEMLKEGIRK